jgi:hypothetical protein
MRRTGFALAEWEAQERVSGVETESTMMLDSAREEVEVLVQKIALLEVSLRRRTRLERWP